MAGSKDSTKAVSQSPVLAAHDVLNARLAQAIGIVSVMRRLAGEDPESDQAEALWGLEGLLDQARDAYNVIETNKPTPKEKEVPQPRSPEDLDLEAVEVSISKALGIAMALSERSGDKHDSYAAEAISDYLGAAKKVLANEEVANA